MNALWKLIALAGVLGVGTVAVLQTQKGLQETGEQGQSELKDELGGGASTADPAAGDASGDETAGLPPQNEPGLTDAHASDEVPKFNKPGIPLDLDTNSPGADPFGNNNTPSGTDSSTDPTQTADASDSARGPRYSNTDRDPFAPRARDIASRRGSRRGPIGEPNPMPGAGDFAPMPTGESASKPADPNGDVAFDPLGGSGSSSIAAVNHETAASESKPEDNEAPTLAGPQINAPGVDAAGIRTASDETPTLGEDSGLKSADGGDAPTPVEDPFAIKSDPAESEKKSEAETTESPTFDPTASGSAETGDAAPPIGEDATKSTDETPTLSPEAETTTTADAPTPEAAASDDPFAPKPGAKAEESTAPVLSFGNSVKDDASSTPSPAIEEPSPTKDDPAAKPTDDVPFGPLSTPTKTEETTAADGDAATSPDPAADAPSLEAPKLDRDEPSPTAAPDSEGPKFDAGPEPEAAKPGDAPTELRPLPEPTPAAAPETTTIPRREPNRLSPASSPVRQIENTKDRYRGDGVVTSESPRGMQSPQITLEKIAPPSAVLGKPLVYSIMVRNVGSSPAYQVEVQDRIPKGTTLEGTIPQAELTDKRLVWRFDELGPGQEQRIAIKVTPIAEGEIGSVATVNFVSEVAAETKILAPKLDLELVAPREAKIGESVNFTFKISNRGQADATSVTIRNLIPRQLEHVGGNDLQYDVGTIPAGESREISLSLKAVEMGKSQNRAVISADGGVSTESTAELEVVGSKLVLTRTGPARRYVGRAAQYVTVLTNEADRPSSDAKVTEVVPAGMDFIEASAGGQFEVTTRTITWHIDRLGPREQRELKVKLNPAREGKQVSKVTAVDSLGVPAEIMSTTLVDGYAAVDLKVSDAGGPVGVGEEITLKIAAHNRGTRDAQNVALQLDVPAEVEVISIKGGKYSQKDGKITFASVPTIAGQDQVVYEVTLKSKQEGDARVRVSLSSDGLTQPIVRDEPVLILGDQQ